MTNTLCGNPHDVHGLLIDQTADVFSQGDGENIDVRSDPPGVLLTGTTTYTSRVIETPFPFNELIVSYNVDTPEQAGFVVEMRVGRSGEGNWSSFYHLGNWGKALRVDGPVVEDARGAVHIDYFRSAQTFDRIQYRFRAINSATIRRVAMAYSNTTGDAVLARTHNKSVELGNENAAARRLEVPFRSQMSEDPALAGRLCSPTSVAMVMAYRGVDRPTMEVARVLYDEANDIYGNWVRAVQGAYTFGVPGYLMRFGEWNTVRQTIANGQPIIASVRIDKGQLSNDPQRVSTGHLLVITGFDENGNVHVNDPGISSEQRGITTHPIDDLTKIWLANGGVGYVLLPKTQE